MYLPMKNRLFIYNNYQKKCIINLNKNTFFNLQIIKNSTNGRRASGEKIQI